MIEPFEQIAVERLGQIVAQLVGAIDSRLHIGEFRVARAGSARLILNVPQIEVRPVLARHRIEPEVVGVGLGVGGAVPLAGQFVVQIGKCVC